MRRLAVLFISLVALCSCSEDVSPASREREPSVNSTNPVQATPTSEPPAQEFEDCKALARYLARGGSSHDSVYDPETDVLIVYSITSRQFRISSEDVGCIAGSSEVSRQVRAAVSAHESNVGHTVESQLLDETDK